MRRLAPTALAGSLRIPASKSQAHRLLILAALGKETVTLRFDGLSDDIAATADCLRALGAEIQFSEAGASITPIKKLPQGLRTLFCRESGSTLRFLLPVCGILGAEAVFLREGRLSERPLAPLDEELKRHGMTIRENGKALSVSGKLTAGRFLLPGNVSSQYVTALLLALSQLEEKSEITLTSPLESADYVKMTLQALSQFGYAALCTENGYVVGGRRDVPLGREFTVEGDYSSAAFFLCAGALSESGILVQGLAADSAQPDRAILEILKVFGTEIVLREDGIFVKKKALRAVSLNCSGFPDLVPIVSILAAAADGCSRLCGCARLRLKESDRLAATCEMILALGGKAEIDGDALIICGSEMHGGAVKTYGDHRMAMAAAIASCVCEGEIVIDNEHCVSKSYPRFWKDFALLKGDRV